MSKKHTVTFYTNAKKIKKLVGDRGVKMHPDEDLNGELELELTFKTLKDFNKLHANFDKGKGFILRQSMISSHNGGDLLKDIGRGFKKFIKHPAVKKIIKTVAPMAGKALGTAAGAYMGNPVMGELIGDMAGNVVADQYGSGVMQDMSRGFRAVGRRAKPIMKTGLRLAKKEFEVHKPVLKDMAKNIIMRELNNNSTVNRMVDDLNEKTGVPVGDYAKGYVKSRINSALSDPVSGEGVTAVRRGRGRPRKIVTGGEIAQAEAQMGLGGTRLTSQAIKDKMALVRSYRKSMGGSMVGPMDY
jgi:hypothetical protein